ncbi:MAG: phytanoyl-CoA dioxygenase family protein [Candidatus Latescibacteria bacterium]|nr:phytanoyl-CoA dioxygenase family protein [Candidatus Latescibacterota bacterium]
MVHLTAAQVAHFHERGYVVVEGLLNPEEDLDPIIEEYKGVLDRLAYELYDRGEISSTYADLPFGKRLIQIYAESGKVHAQYFDFSLPQKGVKDETPMWVGPAVFNALCNERLLDAVESLIGPEISSNPVQHVRLKPPERLTPKDPQTGRVQLGATLWHQDNGVVLPEADETEMLTVWFPLLDATIENGCLEVIPYSHSRGLIHHCVGRAGLTIPDKFLSQEDAIPLPMKRGDVLFMTRLTCHCSLSNHSDDIRWSFDLRYNPVGQPTGRGVFPGFVARSRVHPEIELHDAKVWAEMWYETRRTLARQSDPVYNRWRADDPVCA